MLRATGEQWEAFVAFGVVDQLMRVAGVSSARLRAGRDRSLPGEEPVGVGARILEALAELEQKAPLVIVVDDAQWADIDSLRALLFVARRLVRERVLLVLAERTEDAMRLPEGLRRLAAGRTGTTIALQPLTGGELQRLAAGLGVHQLSARTARRLQVAHGRQPAVRHHVADRAAGGALAHLGTGAAGPPRIRAAGHAPVGRVQSGGPRAGGGGGGAGGTRLVGVGRRARGGGGRGLGPRRGRRDRPGADPRRRPPGRRLCPPAGPRRDLRAARARPPRPAAHSGRPGSSTTRGPPCATGYWRRRRPTPSWRTNSRPSRGGRPGPGRGPARPRPSSRRAGSAPTASGVSTGCCGPSTR